MQNCAANFMQIGPLLSDVSSWHHFPCSICSALCIILFTDTKIQDSSIIQIRLAAVTRPRRKGCHSCTLLQVLQCCRCCSVSMQSCSNWVGAAVSTGLPAADWRVATNNCKILPTLHIFLPSQLLTLHMCCHVPVLTRVCVDRAVC